MEYDLIGDIHGCYKLLIKLLERLSYQEIDGVWQHSNRKAFFLGDLINRGEDSRSVLTLVKRMHDAGYAEVILGNHEFNFIGWHTKRTDGTFLRPHSPHNFKQIQNTLNDFQEYPEEIDLYVSWFRSLPLYIEKEYFRAVHACWDQEYIELIKSGKYANNLMNDDFLHDAFVPRTLAFELIERLLKGIEYSLPSGTNFLDNDGKPRQHVRIKWWLKSSNVTLNDLSMIGFEGDSAITNDIGFIQSLPEYDNRKPLFLGHYCLSDTIPSLLTDCIICLDYCSYRMNRLTSYQFNGQLLTTHRVVQVMEQ